MDAVSTLKEWVENLESPRFGEVETQVIKEALDKLETENSKLKDKLAGEFIKPAMSGILAGAGNRQMSAGVIAEKSKKIAQAMVSEMIEEGR